MAHPHSPWSPSARRHRLCPDPPGHATAAAQVNLPVWPLGTDDPHPHLSASGVCGPHALEAGDLEQAARSLSAAAEAETYGSLEGACAGANRP